MLVSTPPTRWVTHCLLYPVSFKPPNPHPCSPVNRVFLSDAINENRFGSGSAQCRPRLLDHGYDYIYAYD